AAHDGSRLSKLYAEDLEHDALVAALDPVFAAYANERTPNERFGEFVIRAGFVARTGNGADFHADTGAKRAACARSARRLKRARRAWSRSRGCRCFMRSPASAPPLRAP